MTLITEDKLPNLFIPGAGKSGTSSLHQFLNTHPSISMSTIKEPHFWTNPNYDKYKLQDFETYLSLFNPEIIYRGESSTGYLFFENFIENINTQDVHTFNFLFFYFYCWLFYFLLRCHFETLILIGGVEFDAFSLFLSFC